MLRNVKEGESCMKRRFGRSRPLHGLLVCVLLLSMLLCNTAQAAVNIPINGTDVTLPAGAVSTYSGGSLTILGGDSVNLNSDTSNITNIYLKLGSLSVDKANSSLVVEGQDSTQTVLSNNQTASVAVKGTFYQIIGPVRLNDKTTIGSGNVTITGAASTDGAKDLIIRGGAASLSGAFGDVEVYGGTISIAGDTYMKSLKITSGEINVGAKKTFCVGGQSVKPEAGVKFTASEWAGGADTNPTLPVSNDGYANVSGTWLLSGDAKILGAQTPTFTGGTFTWSTDNSVSDAMFIVPSGSTLTLADNTAGTPHKVEIIGPTAAGNLNIGKGYKVTVNSTRSTAATQIGNLTVNGNNSSVTLSDKLTQMGDLTVSAGTVTLASNEALTAGSVTLNGGDLVFSSNAQITGGDQRAFQNQASSPITLKEWGTLPNGAQTALYGEWNLPEGVSATVSRAEGSGAPTVVNGLGGTLTPSGENVYGKGYFADLKLSANSPLTMEMGSTVCTEQNSIYTAQPSEVKKWPTVPGTKTEDSSEAPAYMISGNWNMEPGENFVVLGTSFSCANSSHEHGDEAVIASSGAGTVWVREGHVTAAENAPVTIEISSGDSSLIVGKGDTVLTLAAGASANIRGEFQSVTGAVVLAGKTTINGTTTGASVTGGGQELTLGSAFPTGKAQVQGVFASLTTQGDISVTLAGNVEIQGGDFSIADDKAENYVVTFAGGTEDTGTISGSFKQIVVTGGTLTDSDEVTLRNLGTCLQISGGAVTLDNKPDFAFTESCLNGSVIEMSGGELYLLNGTVAASGGNARAVSLSAAKFHMGPTDTQTPYENAYQAGETPKLTVNGQNGVVVDVGVGAEAWLHAGEIFFEGLYSKGVDVAGNVHLYANEQYGDKAVTDTLLYLHGGDQATAALWINAGGNFDIRGRGVLLEEPSPNDSGRFALYIHENAKLEQALNGSEKDPYPLSGGSFEGKVYYYRHDLMTLIAPNHYLRFDGDKAQYGATDGTYGVVVASTDRGNAVKEYGSYEKYYQKNLDSAFKYQDNMLRQFGEDGFFFSVADAEWELRTQMAAANGSYQIPAGIVNRTNTGSNSDGIILDTNVFELKNSASPAGSIWGMGKKKGDVEVSGAGHVLYFAGRTISYTEKNRDGEALNTIWNSADADGNDYDHPANTLGGDQSNLLYVNADAVLTLRDCVFGKEGTDTTAEAAAGGYIGSGTLDRQGDTDTFRRAVYNGGTLNVVSAQIRSTKEAIFTVEYSVTNIGEKDTEDNSNLLIDIVGGEISVSMEGGDEVNVYGGVVGDIEGAESETDALGIQNRDNRDIPSELNVYGGIITGSGAKGVGIQTTGTGKGTTTIHGGCVYGRYAPDAAGTTDLSLYVNGGTVYLNIDEAHGIDRGRTVVGFLKGKVSDDPTAEQITSTFHHIGNVKTENGKLYVGVDADQDRTSQLVLETSKAKKEVSEHTRINGTLECVGGTTILYQGVVAGKTTVTGNPTGTDYTTEFFVNDGHFADLAITGTTSAGQYEFNGSDSSVTRLDQRVQIHGGAYRSISTEGLANAIGVQDILGFWNNTYDMDEKSAANDWIRYNHYAERNVSGSQDESGYWINPEMSGSGWIQDVPANLKDADRAPNDRTLTAEGNSAIVVRDALWEFHNWLTKDNPGEDDTLGEEYALATNLWLDTSSSICNFYFHCVENVAPKYPLNVGAGVHRLNLNNWGIFGKHDGGALIQNQPDSELVLTNMADLSTGTIPAYERRIRNLSNSLDAQAVAVAEGTLTIQQEEDRGNGALILRADGTAVTVTTGTLTMNAGFLDGGQNGLQVAEGGTVLLMSGENTVVPADGEPTGRILKMEKTDGITMEGRANDGIINAGNLTITGVSGKQVKIAGTKHGVTNEGSGVVSAAYADITGTETGFENAGTLNVERSAITGATVNGLEITGGTAFADKTTITGQKKGVVNSSADTNTGAKEEADQSITVKLYNTCVVIGTMDIGIESSAGMLDVTATVITGGSDDSGINHNGVYLTGAANAAIHAGTQINAGADDVPALRCDSTGTVDVDGGSFARGLNNGVMQEAGTFNIVGGNLGQYQITGGDMTVKNGLIKSTNTTTMPQFVSVVQDAGTVDISGGASMGNYTHKAGTVTVNVNPTFTTFIGNDDGENTANNVTLNSGHYQIYIKNQSGKLMDLIGENAIVICDGGITGGSYSQEDKTDQAIEEDLLKNEQLLQTQTYKVNGESINLAASFSITSNLLKSVEIGHLPTKTEYIVGETLEMAGAALTLLYDDGQTRTLDLSFLDEKNRPEREDEITVSGFDSTEAGEKTLTISYKRDKTDSDETPLTCTFDVKVYEKELVSIAVDTPPDQLNYLQDSPAKIDRTGGMIRLTYDDGTEETKALTDAAFTLGGGDGAEFDPTETGTQIVKVVYGQTLSNALQNKTIRRETSFTISVLDKDISSFVITQEPTTKEYLEGDPDKVTLDLSDCKVTLNYRDGSKKEDVDLSTLEGLVTATGFNPRKIGDNMITLTYRQEGGTTHTATFTVTVKAKTPTGLKVADIPSGGSEFLEKRGTLDLSGGTLEVTYDNGDTKKISMAASGVTVARELDNTQVGTQTILFRYTENGAAVETPEEDGWVVTVVGKTLTFISMATQPTKTEYLQGKDALDLTGAKLRLTYDNGDEETVDLKDNADFTVTGFDNTKPGMQELTVQSQTLADISTVFSVKITTKTLLGIEVASAPTNPNYRDSAVDLTGGVLRLVYDNDTTEELSMAEESVTITGYDSSASAFTGGKKEVTQTLTASYQGLTADFEVTILNQKTAEVLPDYELTASKNEGVAYEITVNTPDPAAKAGLMLACYDPDTGRMVVCVRKKVDLSDASSLTGMLSLPKDAEGCEMVLSLLDVSTGASLCKAAPVSAS